MAHPRFLLGGIAARLLVLTLSLHSFAAEKRIETAEIKAVVQQFIQSPAVFVENQGQWEDTTVKLALSGNGANVALTKEGARFQLFRREADSLHEDTSPLIPHAIGTRAIQKSPQAAPASIKEFSVTFPGARAVTPVGEQQASGVYHFQRGDQEHWRENLPRWKTALYRGLYEDVDLRVRAGRATLKYEFVVAPGGDWQQIQVRYEGVERLEIRADGALVIHPGNGYAALVDSVPEIFQEANGCRVPVAGRFVLLDERTHAFEITGPHDQSIPLVIDPELEWSSYLGGGSDDWGNAVAVDSVGNVLITGQTYSSGWLTGGFNGFSDAFLVKLSPSGTHLWSTYLGGRLWDAGYGIVADGLGNVLVTGFTWSDGWASGGFDTFLDGFRDAFVAKFSPSGIHLWSTYLGGFNDDFDPNGTRGDYGYGIAVDSSGNVLVAGRTDSSGWVSGGFDTSHNGGADAFVVKLSPNGGHFWSTYLGGINDEYSRGIAVDSAGNVLVTGHTSSSGWVSGGFDTSHNGGADAFVVKLSPNGGHLWSTYLGGSTSDIGNDVVADSAGNVLVTGYTSSSSWVTGGHDTDYNGGWDGFLVKLSPVGGHLWSTYFGGDASDGGVGVVANSAGDVLVTGWTYSTNWVAGGFDSQHNGDSDVFVAKFSSAGTHLWSSYLGGSASDYGFRIALDYLGNASVAGFTSSGGWISGGWDTSYSGGVDGFVVKIRDVLSEAPPNDQCVGATAMTMGVNYTVNTAGASAIGDPSPACVTSSGKGVWYTLTPTISGVITISTCDSDFDTTLAVYTGACGALTPLTNGCNDDNGSSCTGTRSSVSFVGTAGITYRILAGGYSGTSGNLSIVAAVVVPQPDFVVTEISFSPPIPTAGQTFTAYVTVKNQGNSSGDGGRLDVWTHKRSRQACGATGDANTPVGTLAEGASQLFTFSNLLVPISDPAWTFLAFVDSTCATPESEENNNQTTWTYGRSMMQGVTAYRNRTLASGSALNLAAEYISPWPPFWDYVATQLVLDDIAVDQQFWGQDVLSIALMFHKSLGTSEAPQMGIYVYDAFGPSGSPGQLISSIGVSGGFPFMGEGEITLSRLELLTSLTVPANGRLWIGYQFLSYGGQGSAPELDVAEMSSIGTLPYGDPEVGTTTDGVWLGGTTIPDISSSPSGSFLTQASLNLGLEITTRQALAAQTFPATTITPSSARLNGFVNPNGVNTTVHFEFGPTQSYGSTTPSVSVGSQPQDIAFTLGGLVPGTTYNYRIVANNATGTKIGVNRTFTTLPGATTATQAWVAGTDGLGLRLRSAPGLGASILLVMPEGAVVTLLGGAQVADGYLWRQVSYAGQEGWAASQYLIFAPDGTPPTAPGAPANLRQLLGDGSNAILTGGTVASTSVVLAATPVGTSAEQFMIQFEVRPVGTGFSAPTHNSRWVRGGSEAQATISGLSNQGYHWRARVLNGNGVASPWVAFNGAPTHFVVNAPKRPSALFSWSPPQVFTDDPVQFTAQASGQAGLTFHWDFGGGQTATGPAVTRSFAQAGTASVTLTVTDAQSNQSQHTETIAVVSKELVERINQLAQLTSVSLDQLLAQAQAVAWATDEFKTGVDTVASKLWLSLVFDAIGQGLSVLDYSKLLELTLGKEFVVDTWSELVSEASTTVVEEAANSRLYWSIYIPVLQSRINEKKAVIEQLRQQAVAAVGALTPAEAEQLARNLQGRRDGNNALATAYEIKSLLPVTFDEVKSALGPAELAANVALSGAVISLTGGAGLIGATPSMLFTVSSSAALARGLLDKLVILSEQSADVQMFTWSVDVLGQASFFANEMMANTEKGLAAVRDRQTPATPAGSMTVEHFTRGRVEQVWYGPRWIAESAFAGITVRNTGLTSAKFRLEAVFPVTLTVTKLFGFIPLKYEFPLMRFEDQIQLDASEERTFHMDYLPDQVLGLKQPIHYTLTARTADGSYLVAKASVPFGTTFLDENGNLIDQSQLQDVLLAGSLAQSTIVQFPGSNFCSLNVNLKNPFSTPLLLQVQQPLPAGTVVLESTGAFTGNNPLSWDVDLQPNESRLLRVVLELPLPVSPVPLANTTLSVYDSLIGTWMQFEATPAVIQVTEAPPPQLSAFGFTDGGFDMGLWTFVPGVYRVEGTTDLTTWQPLISITSTGGVVSVQDAGSLTNALRFCRALRLP